MKKTVIDILRTEILGKKIKSYEDIGYRTVKFILTIDKIYEISRNYIICEVTLHDEDGIDKPNMSISFDINNWSYEIINENS